jgi:hypothetical protein
MMEEPFFEIEEEEVEEEIEAEKLDDNEKEK